MGPIFIALDFKNRAETLSFLTQFDDKTNLAVKIGMELFYMEGPEFVRELKREGLKIFLDLKLYDIPNTVQQAMRQLGQLGVDYVTVHASGGAEMIQSARLGLEIGSELSGQRRPQLLAITQLTSTSEAQMQAEQLVKATLTESVTHLAKLAYENGADGIISSAREDEFIHAQTSTEFLTINPGIRMVTDSIDDQKRVVTPAKAAQLGSNGIVVGRSITGASNAVLAYKQIKAEWEK